MNVIEVNKVTKKFQLGQNASLRQSVQRLAARFGAAAPRQQRTAFNALEDVDFRVQAGEVLGIIGTNGAGKSTLLKVLAGITSPTKGTVTVRGRIAPLIEVGAGLIADLTGRENIYLNASLLGMSYREIRRKIDEIIDFSELAEFMDTPLKRYSSGMTVRLGFSIATAVDADILIVDEVLAVGDVAFQRKCFDRMEDMIKRQHKTVLMVSHNIRQVERLCSRVILLDHGHVVMDSEPVSVCELFYKRSDEKIKLTAAKSRTTTKWGNVMESEDLVLRDIEMLDKDRKRTETIAYKEGFTLRIRYTVTMPVKRPVFGMGVHTTDLLYLTTHHSDREVATDVLAPGEYESECVVKTCPLVPGVYAIRLGISDGVSTRIFFYGENLIYFQITDSPSAPILHTDRSGFFEMDAVWQTPEEVTSPAPGPAVAELVATV
jgi:ABC-type polysaccharide/polyol phosphate transport system ATPase subunit